MTHGSTARTTPDQAESGGFSIAEGRGQGTAAEAVIDLLCGVGIDTFFGVPGGPIIPLFDAILTSPEARLIEPRHEAYAAFEAMGFHRSSGRVPAVVVTAGPGSTNVVTGVAAAHLERVPMLIFCGDVAWAATGQKMTQDTGVYGLGIEKMLEGLTRAVVRISHAGSVRGQVMAAVRAATSATNPGPALVVLSVDHAGSPAPRGEVIPSQPRAAREPGPPPAALEKVARRLSQAERPIVVLGAAARRHHGAVAALIDAIGAPFVTTPQGKGAVAETHPLSLRGCGMGGSWWARRYMAEGPDVALVLGTDLDDAAVAGTPPVKQGGTLIHVDDDPRVFGRNFKTELGLACDLGAFARDMAALARRGPICPGGAALAQKAQALSPFDAPGFRDDEAFPIAPHRVIADLERAAPPGTVFTSDIGEHMLFALHYLTVRDPSRFAIHLGLGSMGSGIGSAVGHALADPSTPVICVCGDGGMQMAGMEALVALKHRLPVVFAVFNDARYNMVYHGYRHTFERPASWSTPRIDFVKWAEAIGAKAALIERPGQITGELLGSLLEGGGPVILDIRQDADIRIKGDGRVEAIRQMSMIHR